MKTPHEEQSRYTNAVRNFGTTTHRLVETDVMHQRYPEAVTAVRR